MLTQTSPILVFVLVTLCIGGLLFALFQPRLGLGHKTRQRMALALGAVAPAASQSAAAEGKRRKRSVDETLREMAEQQKVRTARREQPSLTRRLRQGGLHWSISTYWGVSIVIGVVAFAALLSETDLGPVLAAGMGGALGLLVPHGYVGYRRNRRFSHFAAEFPNAVDTIVRGVKAGMPVGDCLRVVATSAQEPVRTEFKLVIDNQTLGMPVDEAVQRLALRVPTAETRFLAIVITIQSRSGGNLAEALDNLSVVLRERKKMRAKIRAMGAEAKASAWIIGSLPVVVCLFVYLMSPEYIGLLFTETVGNIVLAVCGVWMMIGVLIMRKMINFDF
ncbi:type II secretion system F family protein [Paracoccaceae bacterium Fryx2]|nr:type II secretion system F family protein [Paracoccaceae bacterium Fryx2]